ncbi:MAG: tripartite tricarboxylate transporter TctB family protein, partial [Chloroflexota bacterium]
RADQVTGILLLLFSLAVLYEASKMDRSYGNAPGPGFLPFWLALGMVALSLLLLLSGIRRSKGDGKPISWPKGRGLFWICATVGGLLLYTSVIPILGYILSTFGLMWLLVSLLGSYRWYRSASVSIAVALGLYLLFQTWLGMALPTGLLIIP